MEDKKHSVSKEALHHFNCGLCGKWWTVGDLPAGKAGAPESKESWFCPWCGEKQKSKKK